MSVVMGAGIALAGWALGFWMGVRRERKQWGHFVAVWADQIKLKTYPKWTT